MAIVIRSLTVVASSRHVISTKRLMVMAKSSAGRSPKVRVKVKVVGADIGKQMQAPATYMRRRWPPPPTLVWEIVAD